MEKEKAPLSIRIIYWVTNFSMGLLGLLFLATIVFNILLYTDFFGDNMQLHTNMPVQVDFLEKGNLTLNNQNITVELVEVIPRIHFHNTPGFITKKIGLAMLFVFFLTGFLLWTFRKFIKNVKDGNIFTITNISLLKRLSYGLVGFWIFTMIYTRFFYHYIVKNLSFEKIRITEEIPNYSGILVVALFLWVLAHIFITGLKLQEEKDLTI